MTSPVRKFHPEYLFLAACVAVVAAMLYNVVLQYSAVPTVMRYVPPESSAYAFTSSFRSVWVAADPHVGRFFRAALPPKGEAKDKITGFTTSMGQDIKATLRKSGIQIAQVDDLATLGIDPDMAAAVATVRGTTRPSLLIAVPILSEEKFLESAGKLFGEKMTPITMNVGNREYVIYKGGDWFIAFPDDSTALLAGDKSLFPRALLNSEANLTFFRSGDHAIRSFARLLPAYETRPEAWIKGSADLGPVARSLRFLVAIDSDRMLIRTKFMPPVGQSRHLQKVIVRGHAELASMKPVMSPGNMAAVLADRSLSYYFGLMEKQIGVSQNSLLDAHFPGVLEEHEKAHNATRMSLAVSGEANGVPDVLLGLEMGQTEANDLVFRVQGKLRFERDAQILDAALKQREKDAGAAAMPDISPATLVAEKLLSAERDPLWPRYRKVKGAIEIDPPLAPGDFVNSTYQREEDGYALRFILPPMTDDDFKYRVSKEARDRVSESDLKADKYRLCSIYWLGTLWFGNDANGLRRWLNRLKSSRVNADLEDASRIAGNNLRSKAALFIHPRQLLEQGLLHPDPRVNEPAQRFLSDFDNYRAVLLTIAADQSEHELYAAITLLQY